MNEAVHTLSAFLIENDLKIAVAESCTGGALASALTSISGASAYFDRACIAYSNEAKVDMLEVDSRTINFKGAVSEAVAIEMVKGVVSQSNADIAVSITGIAGPTGGTAEKPVGTVCFGFFINRSWSSTTQLFQGDRDAIVNQSVGFALNHLISTF